MPGLYKHQTRVDSISESEYNSDHTNHISNGIPAKFDDYSVNVAQMRVQTDPGEVGSESLATTVAAELERLRYVVAEMKGTTYWYESANKGFATGTVLVFFQNAAPSGWQFLASMEDRLIRVATTATNGGDPGGSWVISGLSVAHKHTFADSGNTGQSNSNGSVGGGAATGFALASHIHTWSFTATSDTNAGTVTSTGAWRPAYITSLPCKRL